MPKDPINSDIQDALRVLPLPKELRDLIYRYSQDAWIEEVASLVSDVYQMLVKMRHLQAGRIHYPPHTGRNALNMDRIAALGLTDDAMSLLQKLPYVSRCVLDQGIEESDFFYKSGCFLDYREKKSLENSRDAFTEWKRGKEYWAKGDEPYMRPWHLCLNTQIHSGCVMFISIRSRQLTILPSRGGQARDPTAINLFDPESLVGRRENSKPLELEKSRPATDFLRDLIRSYEKLERLPGPFREHTYQFHHIRGIYLKHGWPDNFDGAGFDAAVEAFRDRKTAIWRENALLQDIKFLTRDLETMEKGNYGNVREREDKMSSLEWAKEELERIPSDVMAEPEGPAQTYEALHPFFK